MSHMTRLERANIVDADAFVAASKEMGFTEVARNTTVADYVKKTHKVDVSVRVPGAQYAVGLAKNKDGKYDMLADWWGVRHSLPSALEFAARDDKQLQDAFLRGTTKHTITRQFARQGFSARVTENADRSLRVTLTR